MTHEAERLTSGYRLVLTYKLFATEEDKLSASTFSQHARALKSMLGKFQTDFLAVGKLFYPLEHLYTKPSLCLRDFKSRDRSGRRCLNEICSEAGFYFMLGQTTHFQVDWDGRQGQIALRILYNLNGDQLSSKLVLDFEDFLDYDIGRKTPHGEHGEGLFGKAEVARVFHFHETRYNLRLHGSSATIVSFSGPSKSTGMKKNGYFERKLVRDVA